jgi:hypothetical protein
MEFWFIRAVSGLPHPALPRGTAGFQYREKLRVRKYVHLLIYKSFCYEEKENNSKDAAGLLQG